MKGQRPGNETGTGEEGDGILKRMLRRQNKEVMAVNDSMMPVYVYQDVEGSE